MKALKHIDEYTIREIEKIMRAEARQQMRERLQGTREALDKNGRYEIDKTIKERGYISVIQVLAATITGSANSYDTAALSLANEIPLPVGMNGIASTIHRAFVQGEFLRLIAPRTTD